MPLLIHGDFAPGAAAPRSHTDDAGRRRGRRRAARPGGSASSCRSSSTRSVTRSRPTTLRGVLAAVGGHDLRPSSRLPTTRVLVRSCAPWRTQTPEPRRVPCASRREDRDDRRAERGRACRRRSGAPRSSSRRRRSASSSALDGPVERPGHGQDADGQERAGRAREQRCEPRRRAVRRGPGGRRGLGPVRARTRRRASRARWGGARPGRAGSGSGPRCARSARRRARRPDSSSRSPRACSSRGSSSWRLPGPIAERVYRRDRPGPRPRAGVRPGPFRRLIAVLRPIPDARDWVALTDEPLPTAAAVEWATVPSAGAVVTFAGVVRDHAEGRPGVVAMTYEAYEGPAVRALGDIAAEIRTPLARRRARRAPAPRRRAAALRGVGRRGRLGAASGRRVRRRRVRDRHA